MSIFGIKKKDYEINTLIENHKWVKPRLIDTFQSHKALASRVDNLINRVDNMESNMTANHNWIKPRLIDAARNHNALVNRVSDISDRNVINIFAERQGPLKKGNAFSFGDHSGYFPAGYLMSFPGQIIAYGLVGKRNNLKDDINIIISISKNPNIKISLTDSELSKHERFATPFKADVGDEIKFISLTDSSSSTSTVVSLIIELFI